MANTNGVKTKGDKPHRLHIVLPSNLHNQIREVSENHGVPVTDLLRRFIKLGLLAVKLEETEGSALIIKEGETARAVKLLITAW